MRPNETTKTQENTWVNKERNITKYLSKEFETFVDPFYLGSHCENQKPYVVLE